MLFLSVRRREIEAKKVAFYREKGHQKEAIKVILSAEEREGASLPIYFYHQQGMKAGFKNGYIGVQQHPKD